MARRGVLLAQTADALTLARVAVALLLVPTVAGHRFALAAWLIAAAWISDALDGRSARASALPTRLGRLDLTVDTTVGAGLLVGLGFGGFAPIPLAFGLVLVLGGGFLALGNAALALALQGTAYGWLLVLLWVKEPVARWVPITTVMALLLIGFKRLVTVVVPAFLDGVVALGRGRAGGGFPGSDPRIFRGDRDLGSRECRGNSDHP